MASRKGQYNDSEDRQLCRALFDDWSELENLGEGLGVDVYVRRSEQRGVFILSVATRRVADRMGGRILHRVERRWPNGHACCALAELTGMVGAVRRQVIEADWGAYGPEDE